MESYDDVVVSCYHSGRFEGDEFVGGEVEIIEMRPDSILGGVRDGVGSNVKIGRMWYKLPYELFGDRRPLWKDVDENVKKMKEACKWTFAVDIFVEGEVNEPENGGDHDVNDEVCRVDVASLSSVDMPHKQR